MCDVLPTLLASKIVQQIHIGASFARCVSCDASRVLCERFDSCFSSALVPEVVVDTVASQQQQLMHPPAPFTQSKPTGHLHYCRLNIIQRMTMMVHTPLLRCAIALMTSNAIGIDSSRPALGIYA